MVAVLLFQNVKRINWNRMEDAVPAFVCLAYVPFTYSTLYGIIAGIIAHICITLLSEDTQALVMEMVRYKGQPVTTSLYILTSNYFADFTTRNNFDVYTLGVPDVPDDVIPESSNDPRGSTETSRYMRPSTFSARDRISRFTVRKSEVMDDVLSTSSTSVHSNIDRKF